MGKGEIIWTAKRYQSTVQKKSKILFNYSLNFAKPTDWPLLPQNENAFYFRNHICQFFNLVELVTFVLQFHVEDFQLSNWSPINLSLNATRLKS